MLLRHAASFTGVTVALVISSSCVEAAVDDEQPADLPPAPVVGSATVGDVTVDFRSALALYREDPNDSRDRDFLLFASGASRITCDDLGVALAAPIPPAAEGQPIARIEFQTLNSALSVSVFGSVTCEADGPCSPDSSTFLMADFMLAGACPTVPSFEGLSGADGVGDTIQIACQNTADRKEVSMTATVCQPAL